MKVLHLTQGSAQWKAERRKWATASDMASILGVPGAFSTRDKLILSKCSDVEEAHSAYVLDMFAKGHEAEALLKAEAETDLGIPLLPLVAVDTRRKIMVSFDAINLEHGVLVECKNSWSKGKLELARNGIVWEPYRVQILTQMLVAKVDKAWLYMRDDTTGETHKVKVEKDAKLMRKISKEAKKFVTELRGVL